MDTSHSPSTTPFLAPTPSRAAIIGGGFAGLLAAASLSPHFDEITILERDQVPTTESEARKTVDRLRESAEGALEYARVRRGVPQFLHCHGWLAGGLRAMNELLPGFTEDAVHAGAVPLEKARARTFFGDTEVHPPPVALESKELSLIATRALHESVLHWRVLRDKRNVTIRAKTGVDGLIFSSDKKEVEGKRSAGAFLTNFVALVSRFMLASIS